MILASTNCQKLNGTKVCGPYVVTLLDWTFMLSGVWQGLLLRTDKNNNNCVSQWDWPTCLNYVHHSRLKNQCYWEGICDHLQRKRISTLTSYNFGSQHGFGNLEWQFFSFAIIIWMSKFPMLSNGQFFLWFGSAHNRTCVPWTLIDCACWVQKTSARLIF